MKLATTTLCGALLFTIALLPTSFAAAENAQEIDKLTAAELLPDSTLIYAEVVKPKQLLTTVLEHPISKDIEASNEFQAATRERKFKTFMAVVTLIENELDRDWRPALETLTSGGIFFGFDPATEGAAILIKSGDSSFLERTRDTFVRLARADAANKGKGDPIREVDYFGIKAFRAGQGRFATLGPWLVVTNKEELGKQILDNYLAASGAAAATEALTQNDQFAAAHASAAPDRSAWAYIDLATLRDAGVAKKLFAGKTENPLAELIAGGIMDTLARTPYATLSARIDAHRVAFAAALPHKPEWVSEARQYFFGPAGQGFAPALLQTKETLLALSTYRDLPVMWAASDELYDENVAAKISQADSNLSNLFSGRDFGQEILGAARPQMQFVLARQKFDAKEPVPSIKLPAGAAVVDLTDPQIGRQLKVAFQSLIGLVNFGQAQKGLPQFELVNKDLEKGQLVAAVYLVDEDVPSKNLIQYNLSPTIGFVADKLIISTTRSLASELMANLAAGSAAVDSATGPNTAAVADLQVASRIIEDNRQHLVAQNMLEKGHSKAQAEKEIGGLLKILGYLKDSALRLNAESDKLELQFEVNLKDS